MNKKIRISLLSHNYRLLESVVKNVTKTIKDSGGSYYGPVRLPNKKHLLTLLRSPHIYKIALDQFALTIHKIIIDVKCGTNTLNQLKNLNIVGGIEINIKIGADIK